MSTADDERRRWRFINAQDDSSWSWAVRSDSGTEVFSEQTFGTLKDCVEDAKRHGYEPHAPERRRNHTLR